MGKAFTALVILGFLQFVAFGGALGDNDNFFTEKQKPIISPKMAKNAEGVPVMTVQGLRDWKWKDLRGKDIKVELRSFKTPAEVTQVQCFFINSDREIVDAKVKTSTKLSETLKFGTYQGSSFGWVIRLIVKGAVVRIEANQPGLRDFAQRSPEVFDNAISSQK